jgi:LL-diaminopimelate aminotransferase
MVQTNIHFQELRQEYIFPIIEKKLEALQHRKSILNLGIGDVALPLVPSIAKAICDATQEMTTESGMRGYGPSDGYLFLKQAISKTVYQDVIAPDEIFISEGTNNDATNLLELFSSNCSIGIPDPTYPAYLNSAIIFGRKNHITHLPCTEETGFVPMPPKQHLDIIYLCTPSNPTGVAMNRSQLKTWIDYAKQEKSLLIIDNAYEAFVRSPDVPRSIFEIEGAKDVAVELRSFSKSAGFTGLRCAYAAISKNILNCQLHTLWQKRQSIKSNGIPYIIQKGAEAALSPQGLIETQFQIEHYLTQAKILREGLKKFGFSYVGGIDAPYIWWKVPDGKTSWEFFDTLLEKCHLISIPGCGFGTYGEGFIRLSAFTSHAELALERLCTLK